MGPRVRGDDELKASRCRASSALQHPLRRLHRDDRRMRGFQQALQAGQDRRPSPGDAVQQLAALGEVLIGERQFYQIAVRDDTVASPKERATRFDPE